MDETRVTSSTGGEKGSKLARFDLIPAQVEEMLATHYGRGAMKYADRNWEKGYNWSLSYAALRRHLAAFWNGEDLGTELDPETGEVLFEYPHIAAVIWHAVALAQFSTDEEYTGFDDRPWVAKMRRLIKRAYADQGS